MRDRLIEMIKHDNCINPFHCSDKCKYVDLDDCHSARLADHLLANGVIVPPCKVGDTVYALWEVPTETKYVIYFAEVKEIRVCMKNNRLATIYRLEPVEYRGRMREYYDYEFGMFVFLTKESAENALKARERE